MNYRKVKHWLNTTRNLKKTKTMKKSTKANRYKTILIQDEMGLAYIRVKVQ